MFSAKYTGKYVSLPPRRRRMAADTSLSSRGAEFDSRGGRAGTGSWGEPCPLERHEAPIRVGAQLGRQGVQGRERALDCGTVRGGL